MTLKFDGFHSNQCLLQEAKGHYDQFFTRHGEVQKWWNRGELDVTDQAMEQGFVAKPRPPIALKWYFQEPISFRYFSGIIQAGYPDIEVLFRP